jgi:lipopolysaccharide/colanic/teichoic acid biosynthesis glycosyltransferase
VTSFQRTIKRCIDILGSAAGLIIAGPVIMLMIAMARRDTRKSGLFCQTRIGVNGRPFQLLKIRTMRDVPGYTTTVTTECDPRITRMGCFLRKTKIDELPQFINVLRGDMSFVGPRPDVAEYMSNLSDEDRIILSVRPGITGPASIKYRNEESILAAQSDPETYNREVIFPDKVSINKQYVTQFTLWNDVVCVWETLFGSKSTLPDPKETSPDQTSNGKCIPVPHILAAPDRSNGVNRMVPR